VTNLGVVSIGNTINTSYYHTLKNDNHLLNVILCSIIHWNNYTHLSFI